MSEKKQYVVYSNQHVVTELSPIASFLIQAAIVAFAIWIFVLMVQK